MYFKRTILLGAAFASFCSYPMPAAEASRHASTQTGTTVVNTSPMQAGRTGATTRTFSERIRAILSQSDEKPLSGPARPSNVLHQWPVEYKDEGGTLLFSDSPEYVTTEGILYRDTVTGDARVLYYHLNNTDEPKKVAVVLENKYPGPNQVRVTRGGSGAPSEDYLAVGKQGQMDYWGKALDQVINLPAGGARLLQEQMNEIILQPGQLVYGAYDFTTEHPVQVSVLMLSAYGDPVTAADQLPVLPKDDMKLRGTFKGMNRILTSPKVYNPDEDGGVYFPLADNLQDKYREGIDATDGSKVINVGNYGIVYKIELPVTGKAQTQYYLSPLGGVYAGAMQVRYGQSSPSMLPTPLGRPYFGDATPPESASVERARLAGTWRLTPHTELTDLGSYPSDKQTYFEYSPPGASNLPVNIIMLPAHS